MYFIRLKALKDELAGPGLPEKEKMKYLLAFFSVFTLAATLGYNEPSISTFATSLAMLVLLVIGILYAWNRNGGAGGRSYLERYLSISWVVNFRVNIAVLVLLMLMKAGLSMLGLLDMDDDDQGKSLAIFLMVGGEIFIAWSVGHHVGAVRQSADARLTSAPPVTPEQSIERLDKLVESIVHREVDTAVRGIRPARAGNVRRKIRTRKVSRRK